MEKLDTLNSSPGEMGYVGGCQSNDLDEIFSYCLAALYKKYPEKSEVQLAEMIKIPRSTLNRHNNHFMQPRLDTLIKVMVASGNANLMEKSIGLFDGKVLDAIKGVFQVVNTQKDKFFCDQDLEDLFEDRDLFVTYLLTLAEFGTNKESVVNVLGGAGLEALQILISKNLIEEFKDHYHAVEKKVIIRSFDSTRYHLATYAKHYKVQHIGKGLNFIHSFTEGLNSKAIPKMQDIHRRFTEEIKSFMQDHSNFGEIPYFSVGFCDSFLTDPELKVESIKMEGVLQ